MQKTEWYSRRLRVAHLRGMLTELLASLGSRFQDVTKDWEPDPVTSQPVITVEQSASDEPSLIIKSVVEQAVKLVLPLGGYVLEISPEVAVRGYEVDGGNEGIEREFKVRRIYGTIGNDNFGERLIAIDEKGNQRVREWDFQQAVLDQILV